MEKKQRAPDIGASVPGPRRRKSLTVTLVAAVLASFTTLTFLGHLDAYTASSAGPADEWQDNVWPIRQQTFWDIEKDYEHPRLLEYDVQESTWTRLDVHPVTNDLIFDVLGDIYCISAGDAFGGARASARLVLSGVPYDTDPHFSPDGGRFVYRSDAGLGVDNIWVTSWSGCTEDMNGVDLRQSAQRVTNETYRWTTDARWHPSGDKVVATKWYMSSRSLGGPEAWEYDVPAVGSNTTVPLAAGKRVLEKTLDAGAGDYGEVQIGPEQALWHGADRLIFSKNVRDSDAFDYSKDVHKGINAIFEKNLTSGNIVTLVDAYPGGASRPEISRDGNTLAFVRRVRDNEVLVLKNLRTGTLHHAWDGLTYDASVVYAPMGTYPSFSFNSDDSAIIIWAAGKIWSIPLSVNKDGEKVSAGEPSPIEFTAHIKKYLGPLRAIDDIGLVGIETADKQRVRAFRNLRTDARGEKVVFEAAGVSYVQVVGDSAPVKVPVLYPEQPYYDPTFADNTDAALVVHSRWDDTKFTTFEISDVQSGESVELSGLSKGRYLTPIVWYSDSKPASIAFVKIGGDYLSGSVVATASPGLYVADIVPAAEGFRISNTRFVPSDIDVEDRINMRFVDSKDKILVQQSSTAFIISLSGPSDDDGKPAHNTVASGRTSTEIITSSPSKSSCLKRIWCKIYGCRLDAPRAVAFVDFQHVYVARGDKLKEGETVWSKPGNATDGLARLSLDGGHDLVFSGDGKKIFWLLGPYLHSLELSKLGKCASSIKSDRETFGIDCTKTLLEYQEIIINHTTDIARLKTEAAAFQASDVVVIVNATLLTMETGDPQADVILDGMLVIRGGVIESVSSFALESIPGGATVLDAQGAFVTPGFIDMHAHWNAMSNPVPAKSWELETFLAWGVTTLHNPSSDNVDGYAERSRVEGGFLIGPRIFHTGQIIYGANGGYHQSIPDMAEAHSALTRIKAEGGPISTSYKNYNQVPRAVRQRLLLAAQNLSMICVPEGGMNFDWNLAYILDGMTTVEHSLPIPVLYEDVLTLLAKSGTGNTPTHIVNYGGTFGEQLVWQENNVPHNRKLRNTIPESVLEGLTESTARPHSSYQLFNTSISASKVVGLGGKVYIGAHGEPPLGLNYHAEMNFASAGGLTNYEVYRAATSDAAKVLGLFSSLGSLSPGKLADVVIFKPGVDILGGAMGVSANIDFVGRGGRIWEAETMTEVWPVKGRKQVMPPYNPSVV